MPSMMSSARRGEEARACPTWHRRPLAPVEEARAHDEQHALAVGVVGDGQHVCDACAGSIECAAPDHGVGGDEQGAREAEHDRGPDLKGDALALGGVE
eukprot:45131-Chlamydomonas_euryale.AAC.3